MHFWKIGVSFRQANNFFSSKLIFGGTTARRDSRRDPNAFGKLVELLLFLNWLINK